MYLDFSAIAFTKFLHFITHFVYLFPSAFIYDDWQAYLFCCICCVTATSSSLYTTNCQGGTYTYNTIAFSWQEAEENCTRTGGTLLQPSITNQRNCVSQLFQRPELSVDSTVKGIALWVRMASTNSTTNSTCPMWNASSNTDAYVSCLRPAPYICFIGKT